MTQIWHNSNWSALAYLPERARSILQYSGSLTEALQKRFDSDDIKISVEDSRIERATPKINQLLDITDNEILKRIVVISIGPKPYIYAETCAPCWATEELPWLADLGHSALGQYLFSLPNVERSEFRYALLDLSQLEVDFIFEQDITLWARRSLFQVPGKTVDKVPLLVTEVFMHHVAPSIVSESFSGAEYYC
ncbi:MAG: chorismate lyase [Gammaproteobacteria bacterium]|nr:chorismate lyase [Gammaproteobacteria bacterium]NNC96828.1 chorismate lyase [Gammaproteobacteria bacterium]NNM12896.1 chorismate lyase [Gammaproteobacteria bacterium]